MNLWQITFSASYGHLSEVEEIFMEMGGALSWDVDPLTWTAILPLPEEVTVDKVSHVLMQHFTAFSISCPPILSIECLSHRDWVEENRRSFPPLSIGSFFIYGSHYEGSFPSNKISLKLDASLAFGSGEHATTRGCLLMMESCFKQRSFDSVLDMGCGSGILIMAAAHLMDPLKDTCVAVDVDEDSVTMTKKNIQENHIKTPIEVRCGNGYEALMASEQFSMVVSNILAQPLVQMAPSLEKHLKPGGVAILSGLLVTQKQEVIAAHTAQGLQVQETTDDGEWSVILLKKE